jgi:C2 domain
MERTEPTTPEPDNAAHTAAGATPSAEGAGLTTPEPNNAHTAAAAPPAQRGDQEEPIAFAMHRLLNSEGSAAAMDQIISEDEADVPQQQQPPAPNSPMMQPAPNTPMMNRLITELTALPASPSNPSASGQQALTIPQEIDHTQHSVNVKVLGAHFKDKPGDGSYVLLTMNGAPLYQTGTATKTQDPKFNQEFPFQFNPESKELLIVEAMGVRNGRDPVTIGKAR